MISKIVKKLRHIYDSRISCTDFAINKGVKIGKNCRILTKNFSSEPYIISIGNNTTVSLDVEFITHDGAVHVVRNLHEEYKYIDIIKPIKIGDNCFIGAKSIILPGITIGDNSIVAAGSICTKDIPPNVVAGGVPAKIICTIDDYINKNKEDFLFTKKMSKKEKKSYLLKLYNQKINL